jgi:hypothetical protein
MRQHAKQIIRSLKGGTDSIADIIKLVVAMHAEGIGPTHEGTTRGDAESDLNISLRYNAKTVLEHAVDTGLVEKDPKDSDDLRVYIIAEWMDGGDGEIVNGEVSDAAEEGIEALIDHVHATDPSGTAAVADGGLTPRDVLASEFGITKSAVETRLRTGDLVENLKTAVKAIEASDKVSKRDDYGDIAFRYEAFRYRLSRVAMDVFRL